MHAQGVGKLAVDLIDDHNQGEILRNGFAQDETGLGLRALLGVDKNQYAIDHLQDAFDFAAEIGVPGGIDDIDRCPIPFDHRVLGPNGNSFFLFQVHGIHCAVFDGLVFTVYPALLKQFVHQGGFSVVHVGNNADIPYG